MKSSAGTHRRTPINAWHGRPNTKGVVLRRIQAITRELESLQAEMHSELGEPAHGKASKFFEDTTSIEALNLFKAELDQLRRILWFYTEEAERNSGAGAEQKLESPRLENVSPLRAISRKTSDQQTGNGPGSISKPGNLQVGGVKPGTLKASYPKAGHAVESVSFFDRLDNVIDAYMQEKKPVSAEAKPTVRRDSKAFS